jgi:hypothetical protein
MNPVPDHNDWLDEVERRKLPATEVEAWRRALAQRPRERARLEEELALSRLLDELPKPTPSTNFARRVLQAVESGSAAAERARETGVRFRWARLAWALAMFAVGLGVWWQFRGISRARLAASVADVSRAAAVPGVEVLQDFEAIRSFQTSTQPGDVALLAALTE